MKKLIVGVFLVQTMILLALGIPAGGADNAIWKDETTGIIVREDNPGNTIKSFTQLMNEGGYDAAVRLFIEEERANINGDLLRAYVEYNQIEKDRLVKVFPSNEIGNYTVVGAVRMVTIKGNEKAEPVASMYTLKKNDGKWEIIQDISEADMAEIKQVFERALEVSDLILKDPLNKMAEAERNTIKMQVATGRQYLAGNLEQVNAIMQSQGK